jgi:hypothetical protein
MNTDSSFTLSRIHEHFHDEETAREFFEKLRWPDGPVCPHCGEIGNARKLEGRLEVLRMLRAVLRDRGNRIRR